jgi:hypothetical protein
MYGCLPTSQQHNPPGHATLLPPFLKPPDLEPPQRLPPCAQQQLHLALPVEQHNGRAALMNRKGLAEHAGGALFMHASGLPNVAPVG